MRLLFSTSIRLTLLSLMTAMVLVGCSGSSSPQPPDDMGNNAGDDNNGSGDDPVVTDPTAQNTTVEFNITVPAYSSDALQLRIEWGAKDFTAMWVGDELWSATDVFDANTQHDLAVTFYDDNGAIPLASFEQSYKTGASDMEVFTVAADQFDKTRFDSDGDGVSNLDELIAGTNPLNFPRLLLFSETKDFRHDSTAAALVALEELATSAGMQTDRANESDGIFTDSNLANYDAVVWVMTSGDVLNSEEQSAFENYIRSGGGYAGIHAASFTEYEWPWYGGLVGAYFDSHPDVQSATQVVEDNTHQSTKHLGTTWTRTDEWYDYRSNPRALVNVLLSLDETSYTGGTMGADHPSAWYHDYDGGRSWYTGGGHTEASYIEPDFREHLLGGLRYAAGF